MKTQDCAAIVLAAGLSSRMEGFKPTLFLGKETLVEHVVSTFLQNDVEVYLVVGHRQEEVRGAVRRLDINILENPYFQQGMLTSVQAGVRKLRAEHKRFFVMPVDIPLVSPGTIGQLVSEGQQHPMSIIYPVFASRRGHPPLIPASVGQFILEWQKDGGLKAIMSEYENSARNVLVSDSNILFDIDTPDDYKELARRFQRTDSQTPPINVESNRT